MDIDAPRTRIPGTPRKRETDPAIDDPTTSSSVINADPAKKVPEPRSEVDDQPTPAPVRFSARLGDKGGGTTRTINDPHLTSYDQSGCEWAVMPRAALEAIGFRSIPDDDNLYVNNSNDREHAATIFIAIYVDDLVITSKDQSAIDTTIHNLNRTFNVRSLGPNYIIPSLDPNYIIPLADPNLYAMALDYVT
jgi:hypothetical protein